MHETAVRLDGNSAAGLLSEIFAPDLTAARASCIHCGETRAVGAMLVYAHGMGTVVRCPRCDGVVLAIGRTPAGIWLDPSGAKCIVITAGALPA